MVTHLWQLAIADTSAEESEWEQYKTDVVQRIHALPLKTKHMLLRSELENLVVPISRHFLFTLAFFSRLAPNTFNSDIVLCIRFSPLGTVDFRRSAEALVEYDVLKPAEVYLFTRLFGLDDRVVAAWDVLNTADRKWLRSQRNLGGPSDRLYEHYMHYDSGDKGLSNFMYAVLDRNETAIRHIFRVRIPLLNPQAHKHVRYRWNATFPVHCLAGVYLFLLACYPDEKKLHQVLLRTPHFLFELFEWPYMDCFMAVLDLLEEQTRAQCLYNVVVGVIQPSIGKPILEAHYFSMFEKLWHEVESTEQYKLMQWPRLGPMIVQTCFFSPDHINKMFVSLANLVLREVDELQKKEMCKEVLMDIAYVLRKGWTRRLQWLVEVCLSPIDAKAFKVECLGSPDAKRMYSAMLRNKPGGDKIVEKFWEWCGLDFDEIVTMKWKLEHQYMAGMV